MFCFSHTSFSAHTQIPLRAMYWPLVCLPNLPSHSLFLLPIWTIPCFAHEYSTVCGNLTVYPVKVLDGLWMENSNQRKKKPKITRSTVQQRDNNFMFEVLHCTNYIWSRMSRYWCISGHDHVMVPTTSQSAESGKALTSGRLSPNPPGNAKINMD